MRFLESICKNGQFSDEIPMKKGLFYTIWVGTICVLLGCSVEAEARKYAAMVMDASSGEVLHSRRANDLRYPASMTKVMTLYMLFEALEHGKFTMNSKLKVSKQATRAPPSRLGLSRGSRISVKDAIGTLITKSANDVAVVVAEAVAGSEKKFAQLMTKRARGLGMSRTTFRNASGLYHRQQTTTARDIALMAQRIRQNFPQYYHLFKMRSYTYRGRKYRNHNKLLGRYPGMEGLKTGYIHASGFNLVAVAKRNNQRVITVVFGGRTGNSRDRQVRKLMDLGFSRLPNLTVMRAPHRGDVPVHQLKVKHAPERLKSALSAPSSEKAVLELDWSDVSTEQSASPSSGQQLELGFTIVE